MTEDVVFSAGKDRLIAYIKCEIDHHTAKGMREKIDERLMAARPGTLVIDFSEVGFMDSSGLGLILGRCERAADIGATVMIQGLSGALVKLVRLCGLERIKNLALLA